MRTFNIEGTFYGQEDASTRAATRFLVGVTGVWFLAAVISGLADLFVRYPEKPYVLVFVLGPILFYTLAYRASERVRHALDAIPLWIITIAHTWRFVGLGFVVGATIRVLPVQFGYPEGWGDLIAASLSIPLALALRRGEHSARMRKLFIAWNVFGLIDMLSAITLGVLYSPAPFAVLRTGLSTELMTTFPISLIPTFLVPLFILMHMLSLARSSEVGGAGADDR